jgi:hypothetical protein
MPILKGEAHWSHLLRPDIRFGTPGYYKVNLVVTDEVLEEVKEKYPQLYMRFEQSKADPLGNVIKFKRKEIDAKGNPKKAPKLMDSKKNPLSVFLGNGSEVNVLFSEYEYNKEINGYTHGYELNAVQVLKLVKVEGFKTEDEMLDELEEVADGFVSDSDEPFDDEIPFGEQKKDTEPTVG